MEVAVRLVADVEQGVQRAIRAVARMATPRGGRATPPRMVSGLFEDAENDHLHGVSPRPNPLEDHISAAFADIADRSRGPPARPLHDVEAVRRVEPGPADKNQPSGRARPLSASSTARAYPSTLTLRHASRTTPSPSIRKVERSIPGKVRPHVVFSLKAPWASITFPSGSDRRGKKLVGSGQVDRKPPWSVSPEGEDALIGDPPAAWPDASATSHARGSGRSRTIPHGPATTRPASTRPKARLAWGRRDALPPRAG